MSILDLPDEVVIDAVQRVKEATATRCLRAVVDLLEAKAKLHDRDGAIVRVKKSEVYREAVRVIEEAIGNDAGQHASAEVHIPGNPPDEVKRALGEVLPSVYAANTKTGEIWPGTVRANVYDADDGRTICRACGNWCSGFGDGDKRRWTEKHNTCVDGHRGSEGG